MVDNGYRHIVGDIRDRDGPYIVEMPEKYVGKDGEILENPHENMDGEYLTFQQIKEEIDMNKNLVMNLNG